MDTAAAALPQRPPRARRADRDAAEAAAAAAEAMPVLVRTRSAEKRPREADDDDLPCSCGGGADAAEPPEGEMVPVSWTDTNDALQHFECAWLHSDTACCESRRRLAALTARPRCAPARVLLPRATDMDHTADIQLHACARPRAAARHVQLAMQRSH